MSYQARIKSILDRQAMKQMREDDPLRTVKRNKKPEKETEKEVVHWLKKHGFFCHVVEAKAVFSEKTGSYLRGQATPGFPDMVGSSPDGKACFIELKAKGKISTLSFGQYNFLRQAIKFGAFAVVTDGAEDLAFKWKAYLDGADMMDFLPKKHWKEEQAFLLK